jgi:DegV family protein with EDD domain
MSVAIVTDTGCDLPHALVGSPNIQFVPLLFRFGLEEFLDKTLSMHEFLERVDKVWPTTSAPSPGDYAKAFQACLNENHEHVLCITLSGKHSVSYASAALACQYFPERRVKVIDSASLSIGQGLQVLAAAKAAQLGASLDEVIAKVKDVQRRSNLFMVLDTVKYLVKGGRANQLSGILAGILQIRPLLTLVEGQLTMLEKPRGRSISKQNLVKRAVACFPAETVTVGHVGCEEEAREIAHAVSQQTGFAVDDIPIVETGMAIATHGGPGTLGILVVSKEG